MALLVSRPVYRDQDRHTSLSRSVQGLESSSALRSIELPVMYRGTDGIDDRRRNVPRAPSGRKQKLAILHRNSAPTPCHGVSSAIRLLCTSPEVIQTD